MQRLPALILITTLLVAGCGLRGAVREAPTLGAGETPAGAATAVPALTPTALPSPSPTRPPAATPTPTAPPKLFVRIANTGGLGAYVRSAPTSSASGTVWPEGTVLEVVGPDKQGDGGAWKNVRDPSDTTGWSFAA